jgi:hypothetical protein
MANKNILLIEPGYKNKYPPLGLMKIAAYHGKKGKKDNVKFVKGEGDKTILNTNWHRIYVTSLFTFEWAKTGRAIDFAIQAANGDTSKVFVGGIAATLLHDDFSKESKWNGIRFIKGLLTDSPADSLKLDDFSEELYSNDTRGKAIENRIPDYSILEQINYEYPVHDAYFLYASRGCVRDCKFCGVPTLEGKFRETGSLTKIIKAIDKQHGPKKDLIFMDNNVVASPKFNEIIAEIRELGFAKGAMFKNGNNALVQRRVDFNQGVDARILCKNKNYLKEISTIAIKPLRIAFDNIASRKMYGTAIRFAHEFGIHELSNYLLYNYNDDPDDLYKRMRINIDLNEELKIRIFSFPMRYQPTDYQDRSFVGKNWNSYFLRSMQIILQSTHGIVSGAPEFFNRAFGENTAQFRKLLMRPHVYIFNRDWFEKYDGKSRFDDFENQFKKLTKNQLELLQEFLSNSARSTYGEKRTNIKDKKVFKIIDHYLQLKNGEEAMIWKKVKEYKNTKNNVEEIKFSKEEHIEDAGLEEDINE